jgi:hypothetical protein
MNRLPAAEIAAAWQAAIERDVEAGERPRLALAATGTAADAAPALLALQTAATTRTDVTAPWLLAGGPGAAWTGALLAPRPQPAAPLPPEPIVVFGGADAATQLASWGLLAALDAAPGLAPRLHAGVAPTWEAWPLWEAGDPPPGALQDAPAIADPAADWMAWGVMVLTLCLVVAAFLL